MSLPVGYSDLVLGRTVTIEHIDGAPLDIKIPKNSNSGDTIEIKRRGLPSMRGKYRGDVIVLLKLFMPKKVNKLVKKQLEDMRESTSLIISWKRSNTTQSYGEDNHSSLEHLLQQVFYMLLLFVYSTVEFNVHVIPLTT